MGNTGIVLTAATVTIAVAPVFGLMRFLAIQQLGFALAIFVVIDATVILLVVLPAEMGLAGKFLWYRLTWHR